MIEDQSRFLVTVNMANFTNVFCCVIFIFVHSSKVTHDSPTFQGHYDVVQARLFTPLNIVIL